jgi:hypothetical protein
VETKTWNCGLNMLCCMWCGSWIGYVNRWCVSRLCVNGWREGDIKLRDKVG